MARARDIPGLAASDEFGVAAGKAVAVRTEEVFVHSAGVLETDDIEQVHAMRVATRRLRAVLEIFATCFPKHEYRRVLREVKVLADALGERRDRDVAIEALERIAGGLTADDRRGIGHLIDELRMQQSAANVLLATALEAAERAELESRLLGMATTAGQR